MIDKRDELLYKRLGGEKLSFFQRKYIDIVNKALEYSIPVPSPLPDGIKTAIEELNAIARERK